MKDQPTDERGVSRATLALSVFAHLLVAALIAFPVSLPEPEKEQAVAVELVPPPEPEKAKQEPPPVEEPKPEPKPAAPKAAETVTSAAALSPVVQFGEKDAGPRQALEGDSATDGAQDPAPTPDPAEPESSDKPTETQPAAAADEPSKTQPEDKAASPEASVADAMPAPPVLSGSQGAPDVQPAPAPAAATQAAAPPVPADVPAPGPVETAQARTERKSQIGERIFSRHATKEPVATTAMGGVSRKARGGQLCVTALRDGLLRTSPPYLANLLPSYPLNEGVVLQVEKAAFRVGGQWYNLSFRCEVDRDATRVVDFDFRVGDRLARDEAERRGLPSF